MKKVLAILLAVAMIFAMAPAAFAAEGDKEVEYGTLTEITKTGFAHANEIDEETGVCTTVIDVKNVTLTWYDQNTEIRRNTPGWWVGFNAIAPSYVNAEYLKTHAVKYNNGGTSAQKPFNDYRDSKDTSEKQFIQLWGLTTPEYIKTYGDPTTYVWQFDWDCDGKYEQIYKMNITGTITLRGRNGETDMVAQLDGKYKFARLDDALTAANDTGSVIKLLDETTGGFQSAKTITLDLNGQKLNGAVTADTNGQITVTDTADAGVVTGAVTGKVTIDGGNFDTAVTDSNVTLEGGAYKVSPSATLGTDKGVKTGTDDYPYSVVTKVAEVKPQLPEVADEPTVGESKVDETDLSNEEKQDIADTAASVEIDASVLAAAAAEKAEEVAELTVAEVKTMAGKVSGAEAAAVVAALENNETVTVKMETYVEVTPEDYDENSITLNIAPMYKVVATTQADVSAVLENKPLKVESVEVTVAVPANLADAEKIWAVHEVENGETVECVKSLDGKSLTFTASGFSPWKLTSEEPVEIAFTDVTDEEAWFYAAIMWAATTDTRGDAPNDKIAKGYAESDGTFTYRPDRSVNRAEMITFLWRANGCPAPTAGTTNPFTDVPADAWFTNAVLWGVENNIVKGITATTFVPSGTCTRAQALTFIHRAKGTPTPTTTTKTFPDVPAGTWFTDAVLWAANTQSNVGSTPIAAGMGSGFSPDVDCSRAHAVTFLYRVYALPDSPQ